jgi:hypothetical protein
METLALKHFALLLLTAFLSISFFSFISTASAQRPLVGCYYFDGWSDTSTNNFHVEQPNGVSLFAGFPEREPVTGWYDNTAGLVDKQVQSAHSAGIDFFVFDWYAASQATNPEDRTLNFAKDAFKSSKNSHGMKYALLYVNNGSFNIPPASWQQQCQEWVTDDFVNPSYMKVNGRPLFFLYDVADMDSLWSSAGGSAAAIAALQADAKAAGLPGVIVIGCAMPDGKTGWTGLGSKSYDGYDGYTGYNYVGVPGTNSVGSNPYSVLVDGSVEIWNQFGANANVKYVPVVTSGWDTRPWKESAFWYERDPDAFGSFFSMALQWVKIHPHSWIAPKTPMVMIEAWNELGEGGYIEPAEGDKGAYLSAVKQDLKAAGRR